MKSLLFLLREVPYITLKDIRRFYFSGNKHQSYCQEMVGVLTKNKLVHKFMLGNGVFVYYLSDTGRRILEYYLADRPKYHSPTRSFYLSRPPLKPSQANPFFYFPAKDLEFQSFTPHFFANHPFHHTANMLELFVLLRKANRFLYVLWLDMVRGKKESLNIPSHPDLLLTNDYTCEARRFFIEFQNSRIKEVALLEKFNHLTAMPADGYLFLCSSEEVLLGLGRDIRKILSGEAKHNQHVLFFSVRAQSALHKNVLLGLWVPSAQNEGVTQELKEVVLYRYDAEIFDKKIWMNDTQDGVVVKDPYSGHIRKKQQVVAYSGRRSGPRQMKLGDLMNAYIPDFKTALNGVVKPRAPASPIPNPSKEA